MLFRSEDVEEVADDEDEMETKVSKTVDIDDEDIVEEVPELKKVLTKKTPAKKPVGKIKDEE